MQDATTNVMCDILRKPEVQEEIKQLILRTYADPEVIKQTSNFAGTVIQSDVVQTKVHETVSNVLADEILRKKTSEALSASIYGMFKSN